MKAFIYTLFFVSLLACSGNKKEEQMTHDHSTETPATKYTCPMHPSVIQEGPGKCPICNMDLVIKSQSSGESNDLMLNESQIRLANITTQKVTLQSVGQTVVINSRLVVDQDYSEAITSRAAGRVERLFFKEIGRVVKKGEPLYELYSETLLTLQKEYLLAKDQYETLGKTETRYESFLKASEKKLLLYGLSKNQVEQLGQSKTLQQRITFLAPTGGIITEINASEGQYLPEGGMLYKIENITRLWLEAELYPQETSLVKIGDNINVKVSGYESSPLETKVTFLSPEYRVNTQITMMRALIDNSDLKFKPGTQAQVLFSHSEKKSLAVPIDAVIRDEKGTHVYVETGTNTFQPRMVKTGTEDFEKVEIIDGLVENEIVVISGAYLLYSELVLKKGGSPTHLHDSLNSSRAFPQGDHAAKKGDKPMDQNMAMFKDAKLSVAYEHYVHVKDALVASKGDEAKKGAIELQKALKNVNGSSSANKAASDIAESVDLKVQRQAFSQLSNEMASLVKGGKLSMGILYLDYCPMANGNTGAYWLSNAKEIKNPYFGDKMLKCGSVKETIQ